VKGRAVKLVLIAGVVLAAALAVAPVHCSEGSGTGQVSCMTVFGYPSPLQ